MSTFRAYLVTPAEGPREYLTVSTDADRRARELGGSAVPIDLPATKTALVPFLNELERQLARKAAASSAEPDQAPPIDVPANDDDADLVEFDAAVLEQQVERLGALGEKGLERLEHLQAFGGIGAAFSRGVHLLSIVAAGEHQLARFFLRQQRQGRR